MRDPELPQWMDKVNLHTVAVLTLDDGERMTAEILDFKDDQDELIVEVISSNRSNRDWRQRRRAIPISRVVSCETQSRAEQAWPYSDPCRNRSFSLARSVLMATLFLSMTVGSLILAVLLRKRPYAIQEMSALSYTNFAVFFTFAATKKARRYLFTCPAVRPQLPRLLWRHVGFLIALIALQTAALVARPNLADWWNTERGGRGGTPFEIALLLLCIGFARAQIFTNRSLLDRAHREFSA